MEEGGIIRNTEDKSRGGMAALEGGKDNGRICATPGSAEGSGAHLKCLFTNAHSMRNQWHELKAWVLSQSSDIIGISETRWNESHELCWRAAGCSGWVGRAGKVEVVLCMSGRDCAVQPLPLGMMS